MKTVLAKTKLADLPITWKENYKEKSEILRQMYEDIIGPGSYFRFEGINDKNGDEYYVVVAPARVHSPKAEFFAGMRKLPSDFSASGKYFSEIAEAMKYASETWGVTPPSSYKNYEASDLKGIGKKVKDWRASRQDSSPESDDESGEEDTSDEDTTDKEGSVKNDVIYVETNAYPFYKRLIRRPVERTAMGAPARLGRKGYKWYDLDHISLGADKEFAADSEQWPALNKAFDVAQKQRKRYREAIADAYGPEYLNADFYHIWLSFSPEFGAYIVSVGPYFEFNKETGEHIPKDRFDAFWRRLNVFGSDFIEKKIEEMLKGYSEQYGVALTPGDFIPPKVGELAPIFKLTPQGRTKVYDAVKKYYEAEGFDFKDEAGNFLTEGHGLKEALHKAYETQHAKWKAELDKAYAVSTQSGDAFMKAQPPPPNIKWMKPRAIGQQLNSNAHMEEEGAAQKGFPTLKEAVDFVNTKSWAGCPMLEGYDNVTSEELTEARMKHEAEKVKEPVAAPAPVKPGVAPAVQPGLKQKKTVRPKGKPAPAPTISDEDAEAAVAAMGGMFGDAEEEEGKTSAVILKLVRLAETLDNEGRSKEAEAIHGILRKHASLWKR